MEYRIFFPIPNEDDDSHFHNNNEIIEYKHVLSSLKQLIDNETIKEVREDAYLIGNGLYSNYSVVIYIMHRYSYNSNT
jgi:hypothetical protein